MQADFLTTILLPLALGVIMLGLGLGLTIEDFKRVVLYPRAVVIGLVLQVLVLPAVCFGICQVFGLPPELAVGMMLLAASPGGATANLYSHLAKGDVALNVTLTAVNSAISIFTLPFIVNFAMTSFLGEGKEIPLQFGKVVQVFAIVLIPVGLGMLMRARKPVLTDKLEKPIRVASVVFLLLIIGATALKERSSVGTYFQQVGLAALAFNLVSLLGGYFVPRLARLPKRQAVAIGMEIGIHNGTLAIAIAGTVLGSAAMAIPAAIYSLIMFVTAGIFAWWVSRPEPPQAAAQKAA